MNKSVESVAEGFLYTDQYQLTMAQLYFRAGIHEKVAQFDHFFRNYPDYGAHEAGYCINAGQASLLDWMQTARCTDTEVDYLRQQTGKAGERLFQDDFLDWLRENGHFDAVTLHAIPEGRVVHPNVPLTVAEGPLAVCQILETPLLNHLNYQTLIATRASRIRVSGRNQPLLEFGLRRAQGKGAHAGARAALIGGADFTSNVGLSYAMGVPPKGTHAHSIVQVFMALGEGELGAFRAYADVYPDTCLLLVDTIDTLQSGVPNAIRVFEELKRKGHQPFGIRLDSGDLAYLSIRAAKMLNDAGFTDCKIVLSNQLDEVVLTQIIDQIQDDAPHYGVDPDHLIQRFIYGVGTRLITSRGAGALDGVYKLVGVREGDDWIPAIKVSETPAKVINPGRKAAWRLYDRRERATADLLAMENEDPKNMDAILLRHPSDSRQSRRVLQEELTGVERLLEPVLQDGKRVTKAASMDEMRTYRDDDLACLDPGVRRLVNPHVYHVSLTDALWSLKQDLVESARK